MGKLRVLVVDDEASARAALKQLLASPRREIDLSSDGEAALQRIAELPPDVVVTDLEMPRMDGMALLRELHARDPGLPVIVATAATELRSAVAAMRAGAAAYVTKPIDVDELLLAIERAIEHRDVRLENENLRRQARERQGEGCWVCWEPAEPCKTYIAWQDKSLPRGRRCSSPARAGRERGSSRGPSMP